MKVQTKILLFIGILMFAFSVSAQFSAGIYTLPVGTKIKARMDNEISSKVSTVNDTFTVTVSQPIIVGETEILPVGTIIEGRILDVNPASYAGKNGRFRVKFESLKLPTGKKRAIEGSLINAENTENYNKRNALLSIFGGTALGALIGGIGNKEKGALVGAGIGAGAGTGAAILQKGKESRIKSNQEIEIRIDKEVVLPPEDF